jgi:cyanophycinase
MTFKKAPLKSAARHTGTLIIIGGHESKSGEMEILKRVAQEVGNGKLCVATHASSIGPDLWKEYQKIFRSLGVKKLSHFDRVDRSKRRDSSVTALEGATAVFFTGGDQLKITSELGGSEAGDMIYGIYQAGGLVAGTSAGASVMSETMMVSGSSTQTFRKGGNMRMAPGLGFLPATIVDQHFAERGRIGRLLGAVAQNPRFLGVGIDENTAMVVTGEGSNLQFEVIGEGGVYVADAHDCTGSNISESEEDAALSIFDVKLHVLSKGNKFSLSSRRPKH